MSTHTLINSGTVHENDNKDKPTNTCRTTIQEKAGQEASL